MICLRKNHTRITSKAKSFICILKSASSEESTSSGRAIQSHHLTIKSNENRFTKIAIPSPRFPWFMLLIIVTFYPNYLLLNPIETGFQASSSKGKMQLSCESDVSCFPCCSTRASFNFLYLKMVDEITCIENQNI